MPIRALCTICSDFFDHSRDVAAIHCGHTFHLQCLIQWFETAPSRTCPQCRIQVGRRTIINKLFFDLAQEEESVLDAEFLKNELDNTRAQLSQKEKEKRDSQVIIDTLRDTLEERNATVESLQKALDKAEMLCSTLKKQMKYLEQQQDESKQAQEEARRLRSKMKTMERIELLLQSQRPEVEEMIRDMGVGQSAVEQLTVYCVSLKKEYENLKEARKASGELADRLKKDLFSSKSKLQTVYSELDQTKLELKSAQKDLQSADKEIVSLKKKLTMLQETLNLPPVDSETVNRLVLESSGCIPRSGTAGSYGNSVFNFLRNCCTVLHGRCTMLHPHQQDIRIPIFFFKILFLSNLHTQHGARTHDPEIKSPAPHIGPAGRPRVPILPHPHQHLLFSVCLGFLLLLFIAAILVGVK
uniref:E3 ubiquitin-protein ligase TRAIP isoform X3 n=1 Tax=Halichoerus grypus TaxID=9711 RepID=UPI001658F5D5|nr:E3 ubiquitin-protein ligase TRAIP isoform X3 [Halichoerus grypus]